MAMSLIGLDGLVGCAGNPTLRAQQQREADRQKIDNELSQEMSLKADRSQLNELRKDIPEEKQQQNDELALYLDLMKQGSEQPYVVRDKFNSLVTKKRERFQEKVDRLRSDYRNDEQRRRDDFLSEQQRKRESFLSGHPSSKEIRRFSTDQEKDRTRFFADERARRSDFESELNAHSKDFNAYMRERRETFNEQYRIYSKKFSEKPKEKNAVTGDEFKRLDEAPAKPLGTDN